MNFDYIKSASSCESSCQQTGESGNPTGMPAIGIPSSVPVDQRSGQNLLTNPPVTGYGDTTALGKEINCVSAKIIPSEATISIGESYGFTLQVTYSDGVKRNFAGSTIFHKLVWSSGSDDIAKFPNPTYAGIGAQGTGTYVLGKAAGETTVSVHFSNESGQTRIGRLSTENWLGACDFTVSVPLTVTAVVADRCNPALPASLNLSEIDRIDITPINSGETYAIVEVGVIQNLGATATLKNGDVVDISPLVTWSSSDPSIVEIDCFGNATAVSSSETGATVRAELPGFFDTGLIIVVPPASEATFLGDSWPASPIDAVVVLDRSASMNLRDQDGATRVERARQAAISYLENSVNEPDSQLALVTFAGIWLANETPGGAPQTESDATTDLILTTDVRDIRDALNEFGVRGPCPLLEGEGSRCATGIGSGLLAAQAEINSDRHQFSHRKIILVLTDGCENVNKPDPLVIAEEIKTEGTVIVVVALDSPLCAVDLAAIASPGMFFVSPSVFELSFILGQIPHLVNYFDYGYPFYSGSYP